jgi:hypothetical protein
MLNRSFEGGAAEDAFAFAACPSLSRAQFEPGGGQAFDPGITKGSMMTSSTLLSPTHIADDTPGSARADAFQEIDTQGDVVLLHNFQIRNPDIASYLAQQPIEDQPQAFVRAVEVGVFCLERASTAKDTEFIKRQVERLLNEMEARVGAIPSKVRDELLTKVGTGDGQVLKPLVDAAFLAARNVTDRIGECKTFVADLLDPTKDSSSVGKAVKTVSDMLDPARKDSVQGTLEAAITKVTGEDGAIAKSVKAVVADAIKPLKDEVDALGKEIRGQEAAEEALMQTIEKGVPYEEEVVERLQPWAKAVGAQLQHVGGDNRPGDVVLKLTGTSICTTDVCLVIEARDRKTPVGRKAIADDLTVKMAERSANAAIYLSRGPDGLGREVCDWCEGECDLGSWVATTDDHLLTAIRFLIALHRLRTLRSDQPELDGAAIENQIQRIRTGLNRVKTINRKVTDVRSTADEIGTEATSLRDEIREALIALEDAIRHADSAGS